MTDDRRKPLGTKAYGHIPHLPASRMGPGDHKCHVGQARIATEKVRDRHDVVIVQEKLDGSCVAVARIDGLIVPLGRAGYPASSSPYEQHRHFSNWVYINQQRFLDVLQDGERICGEWLMQAHGTRYVCVEPFVSFDIMRGPERLPYSDFHDRIAGVFSEPHVISIGPALSVVEAMKRIGTYGFHGALDPVEGVVWRVERKGAVDFLIKYVRADKIDGAFLPEVSGQEPVWNWRPDYKKLRKEPMSYMRGDHYVWADDSNVHFWARDGYDNWDDSVWNEASGDIDSEPHPSGISLPFEIVDEFVVMRIAQLIEARELAKAVTRTLEKWKGNGGCSALIELSERLKLIESETDL